MTIATWKPEYTARAKQIWEAFQKQHDLSDQRGKVAAIDPQNGRVWIGDSGVDVARKMQAEGIDAPVYLVRIGFDHFLRKGHRFCSARAYSCAGRARPDHAACR